MDTIFQYQPIFPQGFHSLFNWLVQNKAQPHYADLDFLTVPVFSGMAQRVTHGEKLRSAGDVLKEHYAELEKLAIQEFLYTKDESIRKYFAFNLVD